MNPRKRNWRWAPAALLILLALPVLQACGGGDDGDDTPLVPTGLDLAISETGVWIGGTATVEASFLYRADEAPVCAWYVDGILGGDATVGTITQGNPATYTAPDAAPDGNDVEISAIWEDDETIEGAAVLNVEEPQVTLTLDAAETQVQGAVQAEASLSARGREGEFQWYVNDVLGGDAAAGTITQTNPATYTAPYEVPVGGAVEIEARWTRFPDAYHDMATLPVKFTIKYVDAIAGSDDVGHGRISEPYQTITYALQRNYAEGTHGDTIQVAPGTYGPDIGDLFRINVSWQTVLRGENRETCIIDGNPEDEYIFFVDSQSTVENFTLRNREWPDSDQYQGLTLQGSSTVRNITINDPFIQSAIRVLNTNVDGLVENCTLHNTLDPGEGRGLDISNRARATIRDCTVKGWEEGIKFLSDEGVSVVEGCDIKSNLWGLVVYNQDAQVDLGGGSEGSLGGNTIQNNDIGIYHQGDHDIYALYNTWSEIPPLQCHTELETPCDYYMTGAGDLIFDE